MAILKIEPLLRAQAAIASFSRRPSNINVFLRCHGSFGTLSEMDCTCCRRRLYYFCSCRKTSSSPSPTTLSTLQALMHYSSSLGNSSGQGCRCVSVSRRETICVFCSFRIRYWKSVCDSQCSISFHSGSVHIRTHTLISALQYYLAQLGLVLE